MRILRTLRRWLRAASLTFGLGLVIFLLAVDWIGEKNLFTAFFLFVPGQVWFLPVLGFGLLALLLFDWRLLGATVLFFAGLFWFFLDWEPWGGRQGSGGVELKVMTFNRGQRAGSLRPFKSEHRPDLIAMQEAGRRSGLYLRAEGYEDLGHGEDIGEFMLLSRFPIIDKGLVEVEAEGRSHAVAAWFVVGHPMGEIVIYNAHLPTPRDQLQAFRRGAFLRGLWPFSPAAKSYQSFWDRQIALAQGLLDHVLAESRPVILVGDLNTPDRGHIYRRFRGALQDSHEEAGSGFGWTFPGETRNPLTFFGPWLRIDHQFAGPGWRVLDSTAESGRKSQHLAVVATYELLGSEGATANPCPPP